MAFERNDWVHIANLDASLIRKLTDGIPSDNSYDCAWSPDTIWIAFTARSSEVWNLGIIKAGGTGFKFINKGEQNKVPLHSPCWARDGKSIFCQDTTRIYRLALDGSVLAQWNIDENRA